MWSACLKQRWTLRNPSMLLLWLKYKRSQNFGRKFWTYWLKIDMTYIFTRQFRFVLLNQGLGEISMMATTALMWDIVDRCSLSEMYRNQISQLRLKLALKEDSIRELQQDLANKNLQHQRPEVALQLAGVIERKVKRAENWFQSFLIS